MIVNCHILYVRTKAFSIFIFFCFYTLQHKDQNIDISTCIILLFLVRSFYQPQYHYFALKASLDKLCIIRFLTIHIKTVIKMIQEEEVAS